MRVMILDDERNIVNGLAYMIGRFNIPHCEMIPQTNAEEALGSFREKGADLVIVDINMPGMSGLTFIEEARKIAPCRFVILSGYSDFSYAQKAIHLQVYEYLVKPVDEKALHKIVSGVFQEIYHVSPEAYLEMSSLKPVSSAEPRRGEGSSIPEGPSGNSAELYPGNRKFSAHMEQILAIIHDDFSGDVSITRLSDATKLHPNYISSLFAREMHMGLHKYVESLKLMKAMQMLKSSPDMTMAKIAAALGYFNERQLFRMFKKFTGKTPGQFREELS
jgi:YesN/AraC family two-component response regulator